jgi:hypothetical protein
MKDILMRIILVSIYALSIFIIVTIVDLYAIATFCWGIILGFFFGSYVEYINQKAKDEQSVGG